MWRDQYGATVCRACMTRLCVATGESRPVFVHADAGWALAR